MRIFLTFTLLCFLSVFTNAQQLQGDWLLAYIRVAPPEMTMMEDGTMEQSEDNFSEEKTFVEPGLMLLSVLSNTKAESFYADVKESWSVVYEGNQITFESLQDTLYGSLNKEGMLLLKSTIDQTPTDYYFAKYAPNPTAIEVTNSSWTASGSSGFFEGKIFEFKTDGQLFIWDKGQREEREFYVHPLGKYSAIEFSSEILTAGFGMIYIEKIEGNTMSGVAYLSLEGKEIPIRSPLTFTRK